LSGSIDLNTLNILIVFSTLSCYNKIHFMEGTNDYNQLPEAMEIIDDKRGES